MEFFFELHAHYPKKFCAARAYSHDDHEIGVVCFIICGEGVTKRGDVDTTVKESEMIMSYISYTTNHHFCVALIMEKT